MRLMYMVVIQLALAAVIAGHPTSAVAQDEEDRVTHWFSMCSQSQCGDRHMAGPFPNQGECEHYVEGMKAQGFPFEPCTSVTIRKRMNTPFVTIVGAGVGAVAGYAFAGGTSQTTPPAMAEGAVAGAVIGFGLATLYNHSIGNGFAWQNGSLFNASPFPRAQPLDFSAIGPGPFNQSFGYGVAGPNLSPFHSSPFMGARPRRFPGLIVSVPLGPGLGLINKLHSHSRRKDL